MIKTTEMTVNTKMHPHVSGAATQVPVLVVGAGPGGLTAAIALARQGVESLVVERRTTPSTLPRATAASSRTMELLRGWGLEDAVRAGGVDVDWQLFVCETFARASAGTAFPVGFPTPEQSAIISPSAPACVPQDHLEPVLLAHLADLEMARVEFGTELVSVDNGPDDVTVVLRDVASGETRLVRARYLVAADGARSTVRRSLGVDMVGPDDLRGVVTVLFRAPLWEVVGTHRYGIYAVTDPEADGSFLPAGIGDRWLYGRTWDPDQDDLADYTPERLAHLIRRGAGIADLPVDIERVGDFTFAAQLADRFRAGSTFLIGDAAHRVTPRGGTGMNAAIHDGFDLGWKLAWVLRRWAHPNLLDSYELERRPVIEHILARSADPEGTIRDEREVHVDLGDRLPHVWLPSTSDRVSTLDLIGPGLTLFTGPERAAWDAAASGIAGPPLRVRSLDAITARAIGIRGDGARLVRPDGSPAGWWSSAFAAAPMLRAAVATTLAGPRAATEVREVA